MTLADFIEDGERVLSSLRQLARLPKEFVELGRSREKAGDAAAAGAFFSCASRIAELLRPAPAPAPADPEAALPPIWETLPDGTRVRLCPRCGVGMEPGIALVSTLTAGEPDLGGDVATMSPGGPGRVVNVAKCPRCGHSISAGGEA
jgi:hypothetical protein